MSESNAEFMQEILSTSPHRLTQEQFVRLVKLAEERVMIEEHQLHPSKWENLGPNFEKTHRCWTVFTYARGTIEHEALAPDLSTAIRTVVEKIEGDKHD